MAALRVGIMLVLALAVASPVFAQVATIRTVAPLTDHSATSIETAVATAIAMALRGARAMGLSRVALDRATVLDEAVVVEILASDDDADHEEAGPTLEPDAAGCLGETAL